LLASHAPIASNKERNVPTLSDKLTDLTEQVKAEQPLLLHYPTTEDFDMHAVEILGYLRQHGLMFEEFTFNQKLEAAQLAIAAVEYFIRNGVCLCLACVAHYATGNPVLLMCVRCEVLIRTGKQCMQHAHIENHRAR
jgi:hypothetical protein